jgi:hypothetical protein
MTRLVKFYPLRTIFSALSPLIARACKSRNDWQRLTRVTPLGNKTSVIVLDASPVFYLAWVNTERGKSLPSEPSL